MFKITPQKHTEMPATRHSRETMRVNSYLMRHEAASIPQSLRTHTHTHPHTTPPRHCVVGSTYTTVERAARVQAK